MAPLAKVMKLSSSMMAVRMELSLCCTNSFHEQFGLKVVRLKRNFGQTAALAAGLAHAQGAVVMLWMATRKTIPRIFQRFLRKIDEGNDLVAGWRYNRQDPFLNRRLPSMIANRLISSTTQVKLHDYGCTLKAMRKEVAKNLRLYGEMHRFIPAIAYERGARIAELKVNHRPRLRGKSKYGIMRTLRVVLDLLTVKFLISYSTRPSHVFGPIGLGSGFAVLSLGLFDRAEDCLRPGYRRPAVAVAGDSSNFHRLSVRHHGLIGGDAGAHLS